jgi:hypothetical protein
MAVGWDVTRGLQGGIPYRHDGCVELRQRASFSSTSSETQPLTTYKWQPHMVLHQLLFATVMGRQGHLCLCRGKPCT